MNIKSLSLILLSLGLGTQSFADPCPANVDIKSQVPKDAEIIDCKLANFGSAIPASYNAKRVGPLTQVPSQILSAEDHSPLYLRELEKTYGVKDVKAFAEDKLDQKSPSYGVSMLGKFATLVERSSNPELLKYATDEMFRMNKASLDTALDPSAGSCIIWSAWSMDPQVKAVFKALQDGMVCEDIPFSKGELAELMNAVYPNPTDPKRLADGSKHLTTQDLKGYSGNIKSTSGDRIEDANLALAMMGEFGKPPQASSGAAQTYGENPSMFVEMAMAAKAKGQTMMMDLDPGSSDIWNQPIQYVMDVTYRDPSTKGEFAYAYLTANSLSASNPDAQKSLQNIKLAEATLKSQTLVTSQGVSGVMAQIYKLNGKPVPSLAPLVDQVRALKLYEIKLIRSQALVPTAQNVVRHKLIVQYGVESNPGQRIKTNSKFKVLDYATVNGVSSWLPPSRKLSSVCGDRNTGSRVLTTGANKTDPNGNLIAEGDQYGLVDRADTAHLNDTCSKLAKGQIPDRDFVTGSFPPKNLQVFTPFEKVKRDDGTIQISEEGLSSANQDKVKAFNFLMEKMQNCDKNGAKYSSAVHFTDSLALACASNALSSQQIASFASEYKRLQSVLDSPSQIQDSLEKNIRAHGGDPNRVAGLSTLFQRISQ